jgi:hypothetical protein
MSLAYLCLLSQFFFYGPSKFSRSKGFDGSQPLLRCVLLSFAASEASGTHRRSTKPGGIFPKPNNLHTPKPSARNDFRSTHICPWHSGYASLGGPCCCAADQDCSQRQRLLSIGREYFLFAYFSFAVKTLNSAHRTALKTRHNDMK